MYGTDDLLQQQEAQRLELEEQGRRQEEQRKRDEEKRRQQMAAMQQSQPASPAASGIGGMDPSQMMSMGASMMGSSPAASGIGGAGAGGAGAGSGAGGAASGGVSAWPIAVAALAIGQHEWAKNKGLHTDKDALTGRALYKDSEYYQQKGNEKVGGLGDEMRLGALGSSPADLFRKDTWTEGAKLAARGGVLGNLLKKIF